MVRVSNSVHKVRGKIVSTEEEFEEAVNANVGLIVF